jgi:hypothetical protein
VYKRKKSKLEERYIAKAVLRGGKFGDWNLCGASYLSKMSLK